MSAESMKLRLTLNSREVAHLTRVARWEAKSAKTVIVLESKAMAEDINWREIDRETAKAERAEADAAGLAKFRAALRDIADAEAIPNDAVAFVWCRDVARTALGEQSNG